MCQLWALHIVTKGQFFLHLSKIKVMTHAPFKVGNLAIFLRYLQWELATDHGFLNYGTVSKFHEAGLLIIGLVCVT